MSARHAFVSKDVSLMFRPGFGTAYSLCADLSSHEIDFRDMCNELRLTMAEKDSAMRLFLRHSPECIERLLNKCIVNGSCEEQVIEN